MTAITANTISFPYKRPTASDCLAALRLMVPTLPADATAGEVARTVARTALALIPFSALAFIFIAV